MIYIFGDSFSADLHGWPGMISGTTYGIRGSSEYRILKTYEEKKHLINQDDQVIFCHTSWSRVFLKDTNKSLLSRKLETHPLCDLILSDVYAKREKNFMSVLSDVWDEDFMMYIYQKVVNDLLNIPNSTHITFFENHDKRITDLSYIKNAHTGNINHLTVEGNEIVSQRIENLIKSCD